MVLKEVDPGCLNKDKIFLMMTLLHQLNLLNMVLPLRQDRTILLAVARVASEIFNLRSMQVFWFCNE